MPKQIYKNLYLGSQNDYMNLKVPECWYIVQAAKYPFYEEATGYISKDHWHNKPLSEEHPERLIAIRENRLILNLTDGVYYKRLPLSQQKDIQIMIDAALNFIHQHIEKNKVLVHCNYGMSRSPTIVILYLRKFTNYFDNISLEAGIAKFKEIYPRYSAGGSMFEYLAAHW